MIKSFLKKSWRELVIAALLISCFTSIRSCKINQDDVNVISHKADSSFLLARYYRDKNGNLVGQVNTHELTITQLKKDGVQLGFANDELKKQVGNLKNLVAHWQGKAGMRDTVRTVLIDTVLLSADGSSVPAKTFKWDNKFLYLDQTIIDNNVTLTYLYDVDFSLTAYRKPQRGFWKPPGQLVADIRFSDPNFKVNEFKGFVITEQRKKWYQTNGFKIGAGFVLGGLVVSKMK